MFHLLKHIVIRLWLSLMVAGPASLVVLVQLPPRPGIVRPLAVGGAVLAAAFVFLGWAGNRLAWRGVKNRLARSDLLEKAGRGPEARTALRRAVAIYDSFLPSPLARSRLRDLLTARMARFYLARPDGDTAGLEGLRTYLKAHPGDALVAKAWLRAVARQPAWDEADEAAADRIAEVQANDAGIQQVLGRRFLAAGRTDFLALEVYQRVMRRKPEEAAWWNQRLAALFIKEGRCDNFALETYLAAWEEGDHAVLRRGLAACLMRLETEASNRQMLARARTLLEGLDAVDIEILAEGFAATWDAGMPPARPEPKRGRIREAAAGRARRWIHGVATLARESRAVRWMGWIAGGAVVAGVAAMMFYNTFSHLLTSPPPAPPPVPVVGKPLEIVAVTDPFTIQVAAYLKRDHAERFVAELRGRNLDAQWQEARSNDKTWYQVRISHFADRAAALAYGERLKQEGIIDDYYVVNYDRP